MIPRGVDRARSGPGGPIRALAGLALVLAGVLASAGTGWAQVRVGGFTGVYQRGPGSHPHVFLAVGGRVGVEVLGPLTLEAEAMHVPAKVGSRDVDLFAYRGMVVLESPRGDVRPFALAGAGFQQWRRWVCGGTSCASPAGPGQKFEYSKGPGLTVGGGAKFRTSDPLWFRVDARYEHSAFEAPSASDLMMTLGVELRM